MVVERQQMISRNRSLDVLRGIAVMLVVLFHVNVPWFNQAGWIGVDLFFVLSGFLISGLLFHDYETLGRIRLGRFWFRRAFKILPPLYAFLACMGALMLWLHIFSGRVFASAVFFYSNYVPNPNSAGSLIGHTWSLAIEEHFYLTLPLLLAVLAFCRKEQPFSVLPFIFGVLVVACFIFRMRDPDHYALTHLRVDALFAGVTLRYLERFRPDRFRKFSHPRALLIGLLFFAVPFMPITDLSLNNGLKFGASYLTVAFLVGWCYSHESLGLWNSARLSFLARIGIASYSIYLWQQPICLVAKELEPAWFFRPCGIIFSVMIGLFMTRIIEGPALELRERLTVRTDRAPASDAVPESLPLPT